MSRNVPLRRSLLLRMLAASVVIAVCSIAATAWLVMQSTTQAIQQAQGRALSNDTKIYDALVGYAATHASWDGVAPLVQSLADETGRQIALTSADRAPIAQSPSVAKPLPQKQSAVIDALQTDPGLQRGSSVRIDPRASGPYRLNLKERMEQQFIAEKVMICLIEEKANVTASVNVAGYVSLEIADPYERAKAKDLITACGSTSLAIPSQLEKRSLVRLERAVGECVSRESGNVVKLTTSLERGYLPSERFSGEQGVQDCLDAARRQQLRKYTAPAALLFIRDPDGVSQTRLDLSRDNIARTLGVAALVLLVTVAVTALVGARLVRPLRALTAAAQHPTEHHARMPITGRDEIGVLAMALNNLSERRERAEEQRTAMVSDVAHELRTPLTNIRSWLEALEDGLATPTSDPALTGALLREALQLQHIIDDLQDLAEADATGLRLVPERVRVGHVLEQVVAAHSSNAEANGVILTGATAGDLEITADPVRLRQAIGNLVSNAIRYTPPSGSVTVTVSRDGNAAVISVVDTGSGIETDELAHIFDRFWRSDSSRSRDTGGSGLGLAIVRQIAEAHGGSVSATSTIGQGSCFVLRL